MAVAARTVQHARRIAYEQLALTDAAGLPMLIQVGEGGQMSLFEAQPDV